MRREVVYSAEVPSSTTYSQAIRAGNLLFLSGIPAFNPGTMKVEAATIEEQTDQAIANCKSILRAAGAGLEDVVQVLILLKDPADFDRMNEAYVRHFAQDPPSRAVARLGYELTNLLISIRMTAVIPDAPASAAAPPAPG